MKTKKIPLTGGVILIIDLHDWDLTGYEEPLLKKIFLQPNRLS